MNDVGSSGLSGSVRPSRMLLVRRGGSSMATVLHGMVIGLKVCDRLLTIPRASSKVDAFTLEVDMELEKGRTSRKGQKGKKGKKVKKEEKDDKSDSDDDDNIHRFQIRVSKVVNLYALEAYLKGQAAWDNDVLEAISK